MIAIPPLPFAASNSSKTGVSASLPAITRRRQSTTYIKRRRSCQLANIFASSPPSSSLALYAPATPATHMSLILLLSADGR